LPTGVRTASTMTTLDRGRDEADMPRILAMRRFGHPKQGRRVAVVCHHAGMQHVPDDLDPAAASDGIDEFLIRFVESSRAGEPASIGGSVHVHCTDTSGEWMLREVDGRPVATREHAKGDVAARGPARDLLLVLWGRQPAASLDVLGDPAVLDRFLAAAAARLGPG
jgi:hypothetical protein